MNSEKQLEERRIRIEVWLEEQIMTWIYWNWRSNDTSRRLKNNYDELKFEFVEECNLWINERTRKEIIEIEDWTNRELIQRTRDSTCRMYRVRRIMWTEAGSRRIISNPHSSTLHPRSVSSKRPSTNLETAVRSSSAKEKRRTWVLDTLFAWTDRRFQNSAPPRVWRFFAGKFAS